MPAQERNHTERGDEVGGSQLNRSGGGLVSQLPRRVEGSRVNDQLGEGPALLAVIADDRIRNILIRIVALRIDQNQRHQLLGLLDRQRPQQEFVDLAEDRRVRPDAESERKHSHGGKAGILPLTNVVVNEVLTHTDLPLEDAIELYNANGQPVDISGWWLSDAEDMPRKYPIPSGTILPPYGFKVFYEYQFNSDSSGIPFALSSAHGDEVYLSAAANDGALTGYRAVAKHYPAESGVSFGRYTNSVGNLDYVPMSALSFGTSVTKSSPTNLIDAFRTGPGAINTPPRVGPIVISEIMYHPPDLGTQDNIAEEFIELQGSVLAIG